MIRQFVAALVLTLFAAIAGCSDRSGDPARDAPPPNPAVFAIADANGAVKGWLIGTIHALPDGTPWRSSAVTEVASKADSLLVEVADLENGRMLEQAFGTLATTPDLPALADRVRPEHRARLDELVAKAGLGTVQQRRTESWAAALMLARVYAEGNPANGVDRALIREFDGRPVRELEGVRAQLGVFDSLPEDAQRTLLIAVIEASDPANDDAARLRRAWLGGDLAAIEDASQRGIMADARLREALMTRRNERWMERIDAQLQDRARPLIAVGAAHLVGPDGLIALLEARGYQVKRLP
jgi:uncharacterized protein